MKEADLQRALSARFLKEGKGQLWSNHNGHTVTRNGKYKSYGMGTGVSDLIGFTIKDGVAVFTAIEVKLEKGIASEEQLEFIELVKGAGGLAGIARSWEDVVNIIE